MSKIYMIKVFLLGVVMLLSIKTEAQVLNDHCGTSKAMKALYKARPGSAAEAEKTNDFAKSFASLKSTKAASGEYVIPVVFHVYGTNFNGRTVTDAIIKDALNKTNNDFQGLTADWNDIIPEFDGVKKALNITFKLAQIDPAGNATTGINYYPNAAGFGNGGGYDNQIQQYAWDNYKYMNVYIQNDLYDDGATNNSGVCWYPDTWMSDNNLARCVYNGAYLGTNTDENFRSVLTHEFGHFFNLIHTFEGGCPDAGSCSTSGDHICDTPPANNSNMNGALNCQGVVTNWENFMDYTNNYSMYTIDQVARMEAALQHSTRFPLWQESNLVATGVNANLGPRLMISSTVFEEAYQNNGAIANTATISAIDGAQFAVTGSLTNGTHFTTSNVPAGLSVNITVTNSTTATIAITGNANLHANANSISNIGITFLNPAIVGGTSSLYSANINNLSVNFMDPYQIVYEDITDITANSGTTWTYFTIQNGNDFGIWYDNGNLRLETYSKSLVCEGTTRNITKIDYNQLISSSSNWVAGGAYPDEHNLRTSTYTVWDGQTAYIGFQYEFKGHPCNGWLKVSVASNGASYTLSEYAYNEEPYGSILAGTTSSGDDTDTEVPTAPSNLTSSNITQTGVDLSWTASTDNVGVTGYDIYQGALVVKSVTTTNTSITDLTANTTYSFSVKAKDAAGNISAASNVLNVTTLGSGDDGGQLTDGVAASGNMDQADDVDMWYIEVGPNAKSMRVLLGTGRNDFDTYGKFNAEPTTSSYDWRGYTSGGEDNTVNTPQAGRHYIMVKHYAGSGPYSLTATIVYNTDTQAPSAPTNLTSSNITQTGVDLSWTASTDNVGIAGYDVYQGTSLVQTVTTTSANITGLLAGTNYTFSVEAKDAAGNVSASSNRLNITTQAENISYCDATHSNPLSYFYIKNVSFGSINNSTTLGNATSGYSDYTSQSTSVSIGSSYNLSVDWTPAWSTNSAKVYIDWNHDGDFDDANETVMDVLGTSIPYSVNVVVPSNAAAGNTRMRVRLTYNSSISPCEALYWGETEDYTVNVNASQAGQSALETSMPNARVFPNPASDKLNIQLLGTSSAMVWLINTSGQSVKEVNLNKSSEEIDISDLRKGLYIIKIYSNDKTILKKVIIE